MFERMKEFARNPSWYDNPPIILKIVNIEKYSSNNKEDYNVIKVQFLYKVQPFLNIIINPLFLW
jgi:hypothetical protein